MNEWLLIVVRPFGPPTVGADLTP